MKNIFRKKSLKKMSNEEKVSHTKKQIESSLSMFSTIHKNLDEANNTLQDVITQDANTVEAIKQNIDTAKAELEANNMLQEQIKPFVKGAEQL